MKTSRTIETWSCDHPGCKATFEWPGAPSPPSGWVAVTCERWFADAEWNASVSYQQKVFCGEHAKAITSVMAGDRSCP